MDLKYELSSLDNFTDRIKNSNIKERINHLLIFYCKKSTYYKYSYYAMSIIIIIINASIPIINQSTIQNASFIVSLISALAATLGGIMALISVKEVWIRYRKHVELIKMECMFFNCKYEKYDCTEEEREKILMSEVENIISRERKIWEDSRFSKKADCKDQEKGA